MSLAATPWSWLSSALVAGRGLLLMLLWRGLSPRQRLTATLAVTIAGQVANFVHAVGHIAAGRLVGAPMDELLLSRTRIVNVYHGDQVAYLPPLHLARALGRSVSNLLLAALTAWLVRQTGVIGPGSRSAPAGPGRVSLSVAHTVVTCWAKLTLSVLRVTLAHPIGSLWVWPERG